MIDGMGNSINGTPMGSRPIPPQFKALSEAAAVRVAAMTQTIRSLDGNIAALSESKLRRRCRAAQAGLLNCCTGISLAERERERLYHRSSPALGMLVEREVESLKRESIARGEQGMLASGTLARVQLDTEDRVWLAAGRAVVESDSWALNARGKPVLDSESVQAGAIKIAADSGLAIQQAQRATMREGELAKLSRNWGATRSLQELITTKEKSAEIKAKGWRDAVTFVDAQLRSALEVEPPDLEFAEELELCARPVLQAMMDLGSRKLDVEIGAASQVSNLPSGTLQKLYDKVGACFRTWDDLRAGKVMPDVTATMAILGTMGQIWTHLCGSTCIEFYSSHEIQDLLHGGKTATLAEEKRWEVDPAWLLRGSQPVPINAAFRAIPMMREAVRAFDDRNRRALKAGRSLGSQP